MEDKLTKQINKLAKSQTTPDDLKELFALILLVIEKVKLATVEDIKQIKQDLADGLVPIDDKIKDLFEEIPPLKKQILAEFHTISERLSADQQDILDALVTKIEGIKPIKGDRGEPGVTVYGPPGPPGERGESVIGPPGKDGSPDTPDQIKDKILPLEISDVNNLEERLKQTGSARVIAPPRGVTFYIGGIKKGIISTLNLVASGGAAISHSQVNGLDTVTFTVSGSGITVETPPETPDAIIKVFTVTAEPKWVVADGVTYYAGAGYTYAALQVTLDTAPSVTIRVII